MQFFVGVVAEMIHSSQASRCVLSVADIRPAAFLVALPYCVSVGFAHCPSPRRNIPCLPAAGCGTRPVEPAALAEAAVNTL